MPPDDVKLQSWAKRESLTHQLKSAYNNAFVVKPNQCQSPTTNGPSVLRGNLNLKP